MIVVLATTLQGISAHIAAGVLREHGIQAWVWQDLASSIYVPLTTGGFQLVVEDVDATEAVEVLNTLPPESLTPDTGSDTAARHFSLAQAIGNGLIEGTINFPALLFGAHFLWLVVYALEQILSGHPHPVEIPEGGFLYAILRLLFGGIIWGAILGALGGVVAWHFVAWRRKLPAGELFIGLIAAALLLKDVLGLIAVLVID